MAYIIRRAIHFAQCTTYSIKYKVYAVQCKYGVYCVQCTSHNAAYVQYTPYLCCTAYTLKRPVYVAQRIPYTAHLYTVQCTALSVLYLICHVQQVLELIYLDDIIPVIFIYHMRMYIWKGLYVL